MLRLTGLRWGMNSVGKSAGTPAHFSCSVFAPLREEAGRSNVVHRSRDTTKEVSS